MKLKRLYLFLSFALLLVISVNTIKASALNTGFSTEEISEEKKKSFVANVGVSPFRSEPEKRAIQCFAVNEQGLIAVGRNGSKSKEICVYTSQGKFLYGYMFNCGGSFGVEWDGQLINIFFVRSDVIMSLDSAGNVLEVKYVQDTLDNSSYRNSMLDSQIRMVGNTTYLIRNDMGMLNWIAPSFSQIVSIDAAGTETILYDVNSLQLVKMISGLILIVTSVSFAVTVLSRQIIKLRQDYQSSMHNKSSKE